MFDYPRLLGTPREERQIVVQTRTGKDLENFLGPNATVQCHARFKILCDKHGRNWVTRKAPAGGYNCAGLVWASRRTVLWNPDDWQRILLEDGYRRLEAHEEARVGDVVVYREKKGTEVLHVARVCGVQWLHLDTLGTQSRRPILRALSKWDLTSGESIHAIDDVFLNGGEAFDAEIYTDRDGPEY